MVSKRQIGRSESVASGGDDGGSEPLNDHRAPMCGCRRRAEVACGVEGTAVEVVDADAVCSGVDDLQEVGFELQPLGRIAHDLEDGLLYPVSDALACLGDPPQ